MKTTLILQETTPSLNQYQRMHWREKGKLRDHYWLLLRQQTLSRHPGRVRIEVYRHSTGTLDNDNFVGGCKPLLDALKLAQIIIDDKPAIIPQAHYQQVKVARQQQQMTIIQIMDLN